MILVERWIEGDRNARIRLHRQPWNWEKLIKNGVKWWAWLAIALATGGAWIFYFTDALTLFRDLIHFKAHPLAYATMLILTGTTFFFGGFAREQICIYACPWPRIQAAMMDEDTLTIGYRDWRGEPRGKQGVDGHGDCIDCMACVNVCPMGIDIRDGQQLACITCGLCIDACNGMMDKIGKPRDLISYLALTDEVAEKAGAPKKSVWRHILRVRTVVFTLLWAGVGIALIVALFLRAPIEVNVTPIRNPQFVTLSDGSIRNAYDLRLRNKQGEDRVFAIQSFDANRSAQIALGLTLAHSYDPALQQLSLRFCGTAGRPVQVNDLHVLVGRSTSARDDFAPVFTYQAGADQKGANQTGANQTGAYHADAPLGSGKWVLHVQGHAQDGTLFRQRLDLWVKG